MYECTTHVCNRIGNLPESSRALSAILVHVTRPGGRVVITGFAVVVIVGLFAVVDAGVVRLATGRVDDTGVDDAGRFDVVVAADEDVECAGVVLLSTKWLKSVGGTVAICAVGFGRGRGAFVVSTYETVTNGSAVVTVMFGWRVTATVVLGGVECDIECGGVVMMVVRRMGRSVVVVGEGRRVVVVRCAVFFGVVEDGRLAVVDVVGGGVAVGRLLWTVVDVDDGCVVGILVLSVGREEGRKPAVVRLGGGVRVGVFEVGAGYVVASWTDWNVCNLMLSSVVVAGNLVSNELIMVVADANVGEGSLSMMCCSALDSVLLSVFNNVVIGTYFTVVVSDLVGL